MEKLKLVVATGNKNKLKEIQEILPTFDLVTMKEIGFNEEIVEDGKTFEENALIKARAVWKYCKGLVMADDSGLEIDFLNKEPGIYSARYMGENTSYKIKNENLYLISPFYRHKTKFDIRTYFSISFIFTSR